MKIEQLRKQIDAIDKELMLLLERRFEISKEIGKEKFSCGKTVLDEHRENSIRGKIVAACPIHRNEVLCVYDTIFEQSKKLQS